MRTENVTSKHNHISSINTKQLIETLNLKKEEIKISEKAKNNKQSKIANIKVHNGILVA